MNKSNCMSYLKKHYPAVKFRSVEGIQAILTSKYLDRYDQLRFYQTQLPIGLTDETFKFVIFPTIQHEYKDGLPVFTEEDLKQIENIKQQLVEGPTYNRNKPHDIKHCGTAYSSVQRFAFNNRFPITAKYRLGGRNKFEALYPDKPIPDNATDEDLRVFNWYAFDLDVTDKNWNSDMFKKIPHRVQAIDSRGRQIITVLAKINSYTVTKKTQRRQQVRNMKWEAWIDTIDSCLRKGDENEAIKSLQCYLQLYHKGKALGSDAWDYFKEQWDKLRNSWLICGDARFIELLDDFEPDAFGVASASD